MAASTDGPGATSVSTSTNESNRSGLTWLRRPSCRTTHSARTSPRSGLTHSAGNTLPAQFAEGMFIGQHGSWNREPRSGYNVVFVPFAAGRPSGRPIDVLTGFVNADGKAYGRPVGVAIDRRGALLVADDVGNIIWRVTAAGAK